MRSTLKRIMQWSSARALGTGALLSLSVGAVLYLVAAKTIDSDVLQRFAGITRTGQYTISERIKSYTDLLRSTASLFRADPNVTRQEFHRFVKGLEMERNFPGVEVINYARHVADRDKPAFEQAVRDELARSGIDSHAFAIKPPGRRDEYTVLLYIEPSDGWHDRYGLDIGASAYSVQPLSHSRDTGEFAASGVRVPVLSGPGQFGMAMRLPVYRQDLPTATVEQRRAAYIGSVGMGFGVNKLLRGVLDELPIKGIRLRLFDFTRSSADPSLAKPLRLLFDSAATAADPKPAELKPEESIQVSFPITFQHRDWEAHFSIRKDTLYTSFDVYVPWLAMLAGTMTTALLFALFQTLASSRRSAIKMAEEMTREVRASQSELQSSHQTLRRLAAHADKIKEGERKRIAREIHDDLGQNLLALRIDAEMLTARTRDSHSRLHARATSTLNQIDATIKSVRQIINDLRPNVLDLGLNAAVDWQVSEFRRRTGVECDLVENDSDLRIDDHIATAFFRILQESLSNISRHAHASKARVELHLFGDTLTMVVSDNGIGLPPKGHGKLSSFGLVGIEERVNILSGTFSLNTVAGFGTTITVSVPLHRAAAAQAGDKVELYLPSEHPLVV